MLKEKSCICLADLEKAFYRVPMKMLEWAMRKKGIPQKGDSTVFKKFYIRNATVM